MSWISSLWEVIAGAGVGIILGFLAGATSGSFFRVLFTKAKKWSGRKEKTEAELQAELEEIRKEIQLLEAQGANEISVESLQGSSNSDLISKITLFFAIIGGLLGLTTAVSAILSNFEAIVQTFQKHGFLEVIVTTAYAADDIKSNLAPYVPFIAMGILAIMGLSFIVALVVLLLVPDTKENQARIKSADNIVKTFGGFFTGLATTLLR